MQPVLAEPIALALEVIPIAVVVGVRKDRDASLADVAASIPFAVALDLLGVLALSAVLPLDAAALVSRLLWVAYAAARVLRKTAVVALPKALDRSTLATVGVAAALGLAASIPLSRFYYVHDRTWHGPLVTSLGGQSLPFHNVFEPGARLRYHAGGDVLAAMLRAFSFASMSSHRALASAHDLLFALAGATIALFVLATDAKRRGLAAIAALAVLLSGPLSIVRDPPFSLVAYDRFVNLSFRPHVPLAALLMIGVVGFVATRARTDEPLRPIDALPLVATYAALGLADEASSAMLGLALFAAWLVRPSLLGEGRARGAAALGVLAISGAITAVAFSGSLGGGGPVASIAWSSVARVAPISGNLKAIPLFAGRGLSTLLAELAPFALPAIGLALAARKDRALVPLASFAGAALVLALVLGTHVDVNGTPAEAQRFFLAPFFASTLLAVMMLPKVARPSAASLAIAIGAAAPALISTYWLGAQSKKDLAWAAIDQQEWKDDLYAVDCRAIANAELGDAPETVYVDPLQFFAWTGCKATFVAGRTTTVWPVKIFPLLDPREQLGELDRELIPKGAPLDVICRGNGDPVCVYALRKPERCRREGDLFTRCRLSADERGGLSRAFDEAANAAQPPSAPPPSL